MTDEWIEKKVSDLVPGDEVRDCGVVHYCTESRLGERYYVRVDYGSESTSNYWPAHARVDVRRPVEVTVESRSSLRPAVATGIVHGVKVGGKWQADFRCVGEAEEYAERLRNSAEERAKALGR